jgi:two-component system, NtrC family, sensor kinase
MIVQATMTETRRPRILLVDDELAIARGLARALGHDVDTVIVGSGAEALTILKESERFDLVVSDITMPGMTGSELFERARALDPSIGRRFVFLSGGGIDEHEEERVRVTGVRRLTKPVSVAGVRALIGLS